MTTIGSTPFTDFATRALTKPYHELVDRNSGEPNSGKPSATDKSKKYVPSAMETSRMYQEGVKSLDGMNINRLYMNKNNELKISSNWFSHVFRMVTANAQGEGALKRSLEIEVGKEFAETCMRDLRDFKETKADWDMGGAAKDFKRVTGEELQSNPENGLRFLAHKVIVSTIDHDEEMHKSSTDYSDEALEGVRNLFDSSASQTASEVSAPAVRKDNVLYHRDHFISLIQQQMGSITSGELDGMIRAGAGDVIGNDGQLKANASIIGIKKGSGGFEFVDQKKFLAKHQDKLAEGLLNELHNRSNQLISKNEKSVEGLVKNSGTFKPMFYKVLQNVVADQLTRSPSDLIKDNMSEGYIS